MITHIREEYMVKIDGEPRELVFSGVPVRASFILWDLKEGLVTKSHTLGGSLF